MSHNHEGLNPNFPFSDPTPVTLTQNVFIRAMEANTLRNFLDIQNIDADDTLLYIFTNNPFALSFDGGDHVDIDTILTAGSAILTSNKGDIRVRLRNPDPVTGFTQRNTIVSIGDTSANEYLRIYVDDADSDKLKAELRNAAGVRWALETDSDINTIGGSSTVFYDIKLLQQRVDASSAIVTEPRLFVNTDSPPQTFTTSTDLTDWVDTISANVDNARIGSLNVNGAGEADQFQGVIDSVIITDVDVNEFTEIAHYNIDEGTGTTLNDRSGNGFDGTLGAAGAAPTFVSRSAGARLAPDVGRPWVGQECPKTAVYLSTTSATHDDPILQEG